ncbi:MAG: sigma 54-interacting transcriptional regulator, partial [Terriglobales bacterium]
IHERAPAGIALVDARSGRFLQVNPKLCEIAGRTADEMLQLSYQDITHPEDQADSAARIKQLLEERVRAYDAEKRYVRSDGTVVLVNLSVVPMWGPGEEPRCLVTIVQDITERKRAEERLREFERVVEHLEEMIAVVNRDYRYVIANRAFLSYRGMTKEQVVGRLAAEVLNPEALATVVKEKLDEAFRGRVVTYEMRYRYPEKGDKDLSVTYLPVEGPAGIDRVAAVIRDITERKQAEQALQKSAAELREAQRLGRLGSWYRDLRTDTLVWSEQLYCVLGSDPDAKPLTFAQTERFFTPESWQRLSQANQALLSTGGTDELEVEFRRQDGTVGWAIMHREAVRDEAGKIVGIRGVALDITERRRAEEALRESEERMRLAQEAAKIGCFERNMRTGEAHWTPQTEEMFGLQPGTGPKSIPEFLSLIHPADRQHVEDLFAESVATGRGAGEWRVIWPDGSVHWIDGRWKVFKDQQGTPLRAIGIDSDITERKRVEDELRQAKEKLTEEKLYLEQTFDTEMGFEEIIGQSQGLKTVMEMVTRVAASDATVLLLGETGTGKELVARALHRLSRRGASSFVKMNCAAIPSGLLESELFGAEKGAYTGAVNRKIGRLELADNGTLFLDEIGEIALALQPKLLCVLQDQEFERLGGTQTLKVNFRLIAATNRNLAESVRHNEFRSDLYYRLNVFPIRVPPLRERRDDIPLLVEHFVRKYARRMSKSITSIPRKTMNALAAWDWPGNVRELENFLERSVILTNGSVLAAPLSELQPASSTRAQAETLEAAERKHILEALRLSKGRISGEHGAAARLGLKRTTLQSKLKHMHINPQKPPTR